VPGVVPDECAHLEKRWSTTDAPAHISIYILQMPTYKYGAQNAPFGHVQGWKPLEESDPCPRMRDVTAASESTAARARGAL
jgi:hypothetical protein